VIRHQPPAAEIGALLSILVAIGASNACNRTSTAPTGPSSTSATTVAQVNSVSIAPESTVLEIGETQQFTVKVDLGPGIPPSSAAPLWVSSHPGVLSMTSSGVATALAAGDTTVQVTFLGRTASRRIQIVIREAHG
jgi:Bacterial Ig-like domain (group 2)